MPATPRTRGEWTPPCWPAATDRRAPGSIRRPAHRLPTGASCSTLRRQGSANSALVPRPERELLSSAARRRSVKPASKRWQPPEGLTPEDVQAVIAAAACERDRLLLTTLWATGARISEVLALRPRDVQRQGLTLLNLKNPSRPVKTAPLAPAHAGLPGDLLLWTREHDLDDDEPLFSSRQRGADDRRRRSIGC